LGAVLCVCPRHQLESSADAEQRMTALILGADCLANPTRYDVATIKFMMLWPPILRCGRQRLILTAAPTGEVLEAKWSEIDLVQTASQSRPAGLRRARRTASRWHRAALSSSGRSNCWPPVSEFVFPERSNDKPMSNMVLLMTMRRLKSAYTVHGFRSAFRDWASERTNFAREICEAALAHIVKDKTEAAYRRGDLFEKRRDLMAAWASFITAADATVIPLRRPRLKRRSQPVRRGDALTCSPSAMCQS
jgi:integrase